MAKYDLWKELFLERRIDKDHAGYLAGKLPLIWESRDFKSNTKRRAMNRIACIVTGVMLRGKNDPPFTKSDAEIYAGWLVGHFENPANSDNSYPAQADGESSTSDSDAGEH